MIRTESNSTEPGSGARRARQVGRRARRETRGPQIGPLSLSLSLYIHIYIYICRCRCRCRCISLSLYIYIYIHITFRCSFLFSFLCMCSCLVIYMLHLSMRTRGPQIENLCFIVYVIIVICFIEGPELCLCDQRASNRKPCEFVCAVLRSMLYYVLLCVVA